MGITRREFLAAGLAAGTAAACGLFGDDGPKRIEYGSAPQQFGDLHLPSGDTRGTIVLVHGGAWGVEEDLTLVRPLARDLREVGYAVWNVEYRRVGQPGGGWPGTFEDVGAAIDHLATIAEDEPVDPERAVVMGHSAGGTLALWAASREGAFEPAAFMSLAGFTDLEACVQEQLLAGACSRVLGGTPAEVPDVYRQASPINLLPTGRRAVLVHGAADDVVPVRQSEGYAAAAEGAGDDVTLVRVPDAGHFQVIDPNHPAYRAVREQLNEVLSTV